MNQDSTLDQAAVSGAMEVVDVVMAQDRRRSGLRAMGSRWRVVSSFGARSRAGRRPSEARGNADLTPPNFNQTMLMTVETVGTSAAASEAGGAMQSTRTSTAACPRAVENAPTPDQHARKRRYDAARNDLDHMDDGGDGERIGGGLQGLGCAKQTPFAAQDAVHSTFMARGSGQRPETRPMSEATSSTPPRSCGRHVAAADLPSLPRSRVRTASTGAGNFPGLAGGRSSPPRGHKTLLECPIPGHPPGQ